MQYVMRLGGGDEWLVCSDLDEGDLVLFQLTFSVFCKIN